MVIRHGVLSRYVDTVTRPVREVPSNLIALVGTAPIYRLLEADKTINQPVRVLSDLQDAKFAGRKTPGFTIPHALDAIRDNTGGAVDFINVFDPAVHASTATTIDYTFDADEKIQLLRVTAGGVKIPTESAEGLDNITVASFTVDTDFTVDAVNGIITRVTGGGIAQGATVTITYDFADPSLVTPEQVIGAVVGAGRTGLQAVKEIFNLRGSLPKILLCPIFNENGAVAAEMEAVAEELRCTFLLDAPAGVTKSEVVAGRNATAPVATFGTSSQFATLCYPRFYSTDGSLQPYSPTLAGVMARTDVENGYWFSPSNKDINGIDLTKGLEVNLTANPLNTNSDVNELNEAGVVTIFKSYGTGYKTWGNRSARYPSDTSPLNFIAVNRTIEITVESIQRTSFPFLDRPINSALIDQIENTARGYLMEQIQQGALVKGSDINWNKEQNLSSQIAAGVLTFELIMMVPTPLETLEYIYSLDITLLDNITPSGS